MRAMCGRRRLRLGWSGCRLVLYVLMLGVFVFVLVFEPCLGCRSNSVWTRRQRNIASKVLFVPLCEIRGLLFIPGGRNPPSSVSIKNVSVVVILLKRFNLCPICTVVSITN